MPLTLLTICLTAALLLPAPAALAQSPRPIELAVDATDASRGLFHVRMTMPASPGPLTLAYPKWVQGEHTPSGPITQLVGLAVKAGTVEQGFSPDRATVPWRRDAADNFLFHVDVPPGAAAVTLEFDYASPASIFGVGYGKGPNATPHLLVVDWHDLVLFPADADADALTVSAILRLPRGWQHDTALSSTATADGAIAFASVSLMTLIDSPVLAGDHFRTEVIEGGDRPARLSVAGDRESALAIPPERLAAYRRLPGEALALFGSRHYRRYHWLIALGDTLDVNGLEHHESTDIREPLNFFTDAGTATRDDYVVVHEYVHSWNGKFRRPSGLATRSPQQPLDGELLWVYEGLTRYLDLLLPARIGMKTAEQSREYLAWRAGRVNRDRPGRSWRPLVDTAISAPTIWDAPADWTAYRRSGKDYYDESMLIWLEADTIIRDKTAGKRSLDDFCRAFFGGPDSPPAVKPYSRADLEAALQGVAPYDWHAFFTARVYDVAPQTPLGGVEAAGWRLVYDARPNEYQRAWDEGYKQVDQTMSVGLQVSPTGLVQDVNVGSPAWQAGFAPGMVITSVNGEAFSPSAFERQLNAAKSATSPIEFAVRHGDDSKTISVDYHGGALYPHLERAASRTDVLAQILAPKGRQQPRP